MPLQLGSRTAELIGIVTVDETESLANWLRTRSSAQTPARAHLGKCTHLHTAALQALLAAQVQVSVAPADPFLRSFVAPLLARSEGMAGFSEDLDRRNSERCAIDETATLTVAGQSHEVQLIDISGSGIRLLAARETTLKMGDAVEVAFPLDGEDVRLAATIVHLSSGDLAASLGVKYTNLSREDSRGVRAFISSRRDAAQADAA